MATASTPARRSHASKEDVDAISSRPPSRVASPQLDTTVRYPPPDPLHLFSSGGARDGPSLTAFARQIAASRAPHSAPASQSSSFVAMRPSQAGSTSEFADRAAPRPRRLSPSPLSHPHPLLSLEFARGACRRVAPADPRALRGTAGSEVRRTVSCAALGADDGDAAFRDSAPRNSTELLASPCTSTGPRVAIAKSTRLAISTLFPSPDRAGRQRSSRFAPSFCRAPARSRPSRYGAPAGNLRVRRVSCASGCGSAVAPAGPSPTSSFCVRVPYIA